MNQIEEFRGFSLQELRAHVLTCYNLPTRQDQNGNMMYYSIINTINTINKEANNKVIKKSDNYVIDKINLGPL